jgi:hypothetical protein
MPPPHPSGAELIHPAEPATLLEQGDRPRPEPPAWQRETASLAYIPGLHGLALGPPGNPDAHLLYGVSDRTLAVQVWDIAARAGRDRRAGRGARRAPARSSTPSLQ